MKNTFGSNLSLTIFGESHGRAIGAVLDGMAAGVPVDEEFLARCMDKRRARGDGLSTPRVEADKIQFLSGVLNGRTTGTAIALMIENQNTRSGDYAKTADLLRPGHADYTAYAKYHGFQDARGGGHFSGRITAALVAGGGIVLGGVVLLSGEPGVGKSTMLLQLCGAISNQHTVLYITGEESVRQVKLRAARLKIPQENIYLAAENDVAIGGLWPDRTFVLDMDPADALKRARRRNAELGLSEKEGRFEAEQMPFHTRIREGFKLWAAHNTKRIVVLDAADSPEGLMHQALANIDMFE